MGSPMYKCDYKELTLSFNEFHNAEKNDMPEANKFCLLELKDGRHTAGRWIPEYGKFLRGKDDLVSADEVSKWHLLHCHDLSDCLKKETVRYINIGEEKDGDYNVEIAGFKSMSDGDFPNADQYCLLILNNGGLSAGRWFKWMGENRGCFYHESVISTFSVDEVWAWTALSTDVIYAVEEEKIKARKHEEEINRNPYVDKEKFKYGTDVNAYYEKARERLSREYPWASLPQMKKDRHWDILPYHGKCVFGYVSGMHDGMKVVTEWKAGNTADEFIDFLYDYTKDVVKKSDPKEKFKYGTDIKVYLEKAYENVKKDYHWIDKKMVDEYVCYEIKQIDGDWEYLRKYSGSEDYSVFDCYSADRFIECVESDYQEAALNANPVVAEHEVHAGQVEIHGWYLEKYIVYKLKTGDYKVNVQAGNRSTGGNREFFITQDCFEAETYEEFLDRYQEIVPGAHFGLGKEDLLPNEELKTFFGY